MGGGNMGGGNILWWGVVMVWKYGENGQKMGDFEMKYFGLVWAFYENLGFYTVTPFIIHNGGPFLGFIGVF